jgi:hypothetical protein
MAIFARTTLALGTHMTQVGMLLSPHNHTQAGHWLKRLANGLRLFCIQQTVSFTIGMNQH